MKNYHRNAVCVELEKYCHIAKEHDFIEVCFWENGEGFDVSIGDRIFMLSWGELDAINVLSKVKM